MGLIELVRTNLLWSEAPYLVVILLVLMFVGWRLRWRVLTCLVFGLFCFCLFFFRNPARVCPQVVCDDAIIVCPADGKVVAIDRLQQGEFAQRVAIFLSLFDAHVNWLPVSGTIEQIVYTPGTFGFAHRAKSSIYNERNEVVIQTLAGDMVMVRQIAGAIARRIACWVNEGQHVVAGRKLGMIKFGSRVELLLPEDTELSVTIGQRVYGGQTILGRFVRG